VTLRRLTRALVLLALLVALSRAFGRAGPLLDGTAIGHVVDQLVQHVERAIGRLR
jgi:hypothetical protein